MKIKVQVLGWQEQPSGPDFLLVHEPLEDGRLTTRVYDPERHEIDSEDHDTYLELLKKYRGLQAAVDETMEHIKSVDIKRLDKAKVLHYCDMFMAVRAARADLAERQCLCARDI